MKSRADSKLPKALNVFAIQDFQGHALKFHCESNTRESQARRYHPQNNLHSVRQLSDQKSRSSIQNRILVFQNQLASQNSTRHNFFHHLKCDRVQADARCSRESAEASDQERAVNLSYQSDTQEQKEVRVLLPPLSL